jgi:sulfite exporter TauE/SafE
MLIGLGLWSLWGRRATTIPLVTLGASKRPSLLDRGRLALGRLLQRSGPSAALGVGLLSALLPCAWLWSFLAAAAATGSASSGALTMLVFWAGTVPALTGVGLLAGTVGRHLGRHAPRIIAVIMIGLGAAALVGRASMQPAGDAECHVRGVE